MVGYKDIAALALVGGVAYVGYRMLTELQGMPVAAVNTVTGAPVAQNYVQQAVATLTGQPAAATPETPAMDLLASILSAVAPGTNLLWAWDKQIYAEATQVDYSAGISYLGPADWLISELKAGTWGTPESWRDYWLRETPEYAAYVQYIYSEAKK